jgi:hypothetical protein
MKSSDSKLFRPTRLLFCWVPRVLTTLFLRWVRCAVGKWWVTWVPVT